MADTQMYSIFRHDDAVLDGENDEAAADETSINEVILSYYESSTVQELQMVPMISHMVGGDWNIYLLFFPFSWE